MSILWRGAGLLSRSFSLNLNFSRTFSHKMKPKIIDDKNQMQQKATKAKEVEDKSIQIVKEK